MDRRDFGKLLTLGLIGAEIVPGIFHRSDLATGQGFPGHWKAEKHIALFIIS
jgi:hypothetical protein